MLNRYIEKLKVGAYREFAPSDAHLGIENVWHHIVSIHANSGCEHRLVPEPTINLAYSRQFNLSGDLVHNGLYMFGPVTTPRSFALRPGEELIAVRIAPEWALPAFGFHVSEINDDAALLKNIAPFLYEQLRNGICDTAEPHIIADQLLAETNKALAQLTFNRFECRTTCHIASEIRRSNGLIDVSRFSAETGFSERHIRRKAAQHLGMSPKEFSTSTRFLNTLRYVDLAQKHDWADIAVLFGYFDQSHLINDFKRFSGLTPPQLLESRRHESAFLESVN